MRAPSGLSRKASTEGNVEDGHRVASEYPSSKMDEVRRKPAWLSKMDLKNA
jgi:hypothetical protein